MDCFVRCLREGSSDASSTSVFLIEDNLASVRGSAVTEAACPAALCAPLLLTPEVLSRLISADIALGSVQDALWCLHAVR